MPKATETQQPQTNLTQEAAPAFSPEMLQALLEQNNAFLRKISELEGKLRVEEQPKQVVHEIRSEVPVPKRIKYKISALEADNAMVNGFYVPGKKIMGDFMYTSEIWMDNDGNYRTGFELDKLEFQTGLKGQDLTNYQNEVKAVINYLSSVTDQNLSSRNENFWRNRGIKVESLGMEYDTQNTEHLINYYNILAGSFPEIGKNREDALSRGKLLYLDVAEQEATQKMSVKMQKLDAGAALVKVRDEWKTKDILLLIYAISNKKTHGYTLDTPKNILINELSEFIDGEGTTTDKKKRPSQFIEAVNRMNSPTEKERIRVEGLIKAGLYYGYVRNNKEKAFELKESGNIMGTTIKAAVDYLTNQANIEDFGYLNASITKKWTD